MRFLKAPKCAICGNDTMLCQGDVTVFHMVFKCNSCKTEYDYKTGVEIFKDDNTSQSNYAIDNRRERTLYITKRTTISSTHNNTI